MPSAEDREQLEELERRQIASWGRDGAAFAATFTEDADLVDVMGGHYRGRASIEATMTEGFAGFMAGTRMSAPTERTVDFISADTAVVSRAATASSVTTRPGAAPRICPFRRRSPSGSAASGCSARSRTPESCPDPSRSKGLRHAANPGLTPRARQPRHPRPPGRGHPAAHRRTPRRRPDGAGHRA